MLLQFKCLAVRCGCLLANRTHFLERYLRVESRYLSQEGAKLGGKASALIGQPSRFVPASNLVSLATDPTLLFGVSRLELRVIRSNVVAQRDRLLRHRDRFGRRGPFVVSRYQSISDLTPQALGQGPQ